MMNLKREKALKTAKQHKRKKAFRSGFTLAETLLTLVIIGVISAMTIPALKKNTADIETVAQLKKQYAALCLAVELSERDNGPMSRWKISGTPEEMFFTYFAPFLNVITKCGSDDDCWGGPVKNASGGIYEEGYYKVILADGTRMSVLFQSYAHIHVLFDLNGSKKPNKLGVDVFLLTITGGPLNDGVHKVSDSGVYFYGQGLERTALLGSCKSNGFTCGALIAMDGWQLSKDYP